MRVGILTCSERGSAAYCLPKLVDNDAFHLAGIVVAAPTVSNRRKHFTRKMQKCWRIGLLGAINGLRLRKWYDQPTRPISELAAQHGIPIANVDGTNSNACRECLKSFDLDLVVSLGNPFISPSTFSIPRYGMLNVHGELLPEYPGAQSVIWPIYESSSLTGFSIHQVSKVIDGGKVHFRAELPILFAPTLFETVQKTVENVRQHIPNALSRTIEAFPRVLTAEVHQKPRRSVYTTPSYSEFLRMCRNNYLMHQEQSVSAKPEE
jgi:methionyl-tRNA formyltransferase